MLRPKESTPLYSTSTHQGVSVDTYRLGGSKYGMGIISLQVHNKNRDRFKLGCLCRTIGINTKALTLLFRVKEAGVRAAAALNTCATLKGIKLQQVAHRVSAWANTDCQFRQ